MVKTFFVPWRQESMIIDRVSSVDRRVGSGEDLAVKVSLT